jgi:Sigma-70 region 2
VRRRQGSAAAGDAAIIESSWREPERFAVLFDRHAPHIHRYLARRAGREVADDLVAETFLAAFAKRHRYDLGRADARPWLSGLGAVWMLWRPASSAFFKSAKQMRSRPSSQISGP